MNRQELVEAIAASADISKTAADAAVKALIETIGDELQNRQKPSDRCRDKDRSLHRS